MSCLLLDWDRPENAREVLSLLRSGQPVALPTETVYGLASLLSEQSLARVFEIKNRPFFDPLIVHCSNLMQVEQYVEPLSVLERKVANTFWPGLLTLILRRRPKMVPDLCTAGLETVGIRIPAHPVFRAVLDSCGTPLAAPSANPFGRTSPTSARDVVIDLGPCGLAGVVEGGSSQVGVESTILDLSHPERSLCYRPGGLAIEDIEACIGVKIEIVSPSSKTGEDALVAPGSLLSHYAPRKPLFFCERGQTPPDIILHESKNTAAIFMSPQSVIPGVWKQVFVLAESGEFTLAAANLFRILRQADASEASQIFAVGAEDKGLGRAINDRLRRAGHRL